MIIDAILTILFAPIIALIEIFPTFNLFNNVEMPNSLITLITNVSCIAPVGTFFTAIGIWFTTSNLTILSAVVHWIMRKIPGIS